MKTKIKYRTPLGVVKHWIKTLRSGKYTQTTGQLKTTHGFCCLGVLCDLAEKDGGDKWIIKGDPRLLPHTYRNTANFLPYLIQDYIGMTTSQVSELMSMNDNQRKDFYEIADQIAKWYNLK